MVWHFLLSDLDSVAFSLLHTLNEGLDSSRHLLCQFIPGNVIRWFRCKPCRLIIIAIWITIDKFGMRSSAQSWRTDIWIDALAVTESVPCSQTSQLRDGSCLQEWAIRLLETSASAKNVWDHLCLTWFFWNTAKITDFCLTQMVFSLRLDVLGCVWNQTWILLQKFLYWGVLCPLGTRCNRYWLQRCLQSLAQFHYWVPLWKFLILLSKKVFIHTSQMRIVFIELIAHRGTFIQATSCLYTTLLWLLFGIWAS